MLSAIFPEEDYNSILRKQMATLFCSSYHQEMESISLGFESQFGHIICFGQRDISKHGISRGLTSACSLGLVLCLAVLGTPLPCEKAQSSLLDTGDM